MKREYRILKHSEFDRIIAGGKCIRTAHFRLFYLAEESNEHIRIGIALGKANGTAVRRVKEKRQVRAMLAKRNDYSPKLNLIIIIRPNYDPDSDFEMEEELNGAINQIEGALH